MPHTVKTIIYVLIIVIAGFAAGFMASEKFHKRKEGKASYVQRREGAFRHINPLLECDIAEDVLRNRELIPFKDKVATYINSRMDKRWASSVSVYFRELNDGIWFGIGDTEKFVPASLRKLPLMVALLKMAEHQKGDLLNSQVTFDLSRDYNQDQNFKPSQQMAPGRQYTVKDLIYRMIAYSDNNAFTLLTRVVDPVEFDQVYSLLRMQNPRVLTDDQFLSVQTYASFFRVLYNATYLNKEHSEWALEVLGRSEFRDGLVAGVPPTVPVSHKFGEKSDASSGMMQLHDCGIVYYPNNPYLLCIMSKGPSFEYLDDVMKAVSRIVYDEVAEQNKASR